MEPPAYDLSPLLEELDDGDIELQFRDGRTIKAHSVKLKLASKGILRNLLEDVLQGEILAKRRKVDEETRSKGPLGPMHIQQSMPALAVGWG